MKRLPIGIQSIEKILGKGAYVYVDKTQFALELIEGDAPHYFLSRPRRFGKSLFVSTLKEIFLGNKTLFKECHIYNSGYDWPTYPVLSFDFGKIANTTTEKLEAHLSAMLTRMGSLQGINTQGPSVEFQLSVLIEELANQGPVVVLIDEYDSPLVDNLKKPEVAEENRELLRSFYKVLKSQEEHIRFTFVTGISKFSQVSLFSGPNHLDDITMYPQYATIMGYTEEELIQCFDQHIQAITEARNQQGQESPDKEVLAEIKQWYNGYRFSEAESYVYNPFSTLKFMETKKAKSHWYSTGTPSFLIEQVNKHPESMVPLAGTSARASKLMDISSLEDIDLTALMFQTGYLTITGYSAVSQHYQLGFPNQEVREAFIDSLATHFVPRDADFSVKSKGALQEQNLSAFFAQLEVALARFPYQLFTEAQERTYHGMVLSLMSGMGLEVSAERPSSLGRVDLLVELPATTYVMELKLDSSAEAALAQIREKQYYVPHLRKDKEVVIVGLNFSSKTRNVGGWCGELLNEHGEGVRVLAPAPV
ncbi:MAG: AAA family ATPase [Roseivirga sp.]